MGRVSHPRKAFWGILAGACLLAGYLIFDISRFAWCCRSFSARSLMGMEQIRQRKNNDEAIVVLTGDRSRIPRALELMRNRDSPFVLISGTAKGISLRDVVNRQGDATTNIHEIWQRIVLESKSSSTLENARESDKILSERNVKRVILVTSDYHMCRSLDVFSRVSPDREYIPYPVASEVAMMGNGGGFLEGLSKVWVEYWKFFLFRHFYALTL